MKKHLYWAVTLAITLVLTSCVNLTYNYYGTTDAIKDTETHPVKQPETEAPASDLVSEADTKADEPQSEVTDNASTPAEAVTDEITNVETTEAEITEAKAAEAESTHTEGSEPVEPDLRSVSLWIEDLTTPISINKTATISAFGKPGTYYMIVVYYSTKRSSAKGLEGKHADENGRVEWSWKIGASVKPGVYRIVISGDEESVESEIEISEN